MEDKSEKPVENKIISGDGSEEEEELIFNPYNPNNV